MLLDLNKHFDENHNSSSPRDRRSSSQWNKNSSTTRKATQNGSRTNLGDRNRINPLQQFKLSEEQLPNIRREDERESAFSGLKKQNSRTTKILNATKYWRKSDRSKRREEEAAMTFPRNIILHKNPRRVDASSDFKVKSRELPSRKKSSSLNLAQIASNITIKNAERYKIPMKAAQTKSGGGQLQGKYSGEGQRKNQRSGSNVFLTNLSYDESLMRDLVVVQKDEVLPVKEMTRGNQRQKDDKKAIRVSISEDQATRIKKKRPELFISFKKNTLKDVQAPASEKEKFFRIQTKEMTPWEGYELKPSFGVKRSLWAQTVQAYLSDNPKAQADLGYASGTIFHHDRGSKERGTQLPKLFSPKRTLNANYFNI